jgi:Mg2+-importing ATPase
MTTPPVSEQNQSSSQKLPRVAEGVLTNPPSKNPAFWSQSSEDAFRRLQTGVFGLTRAEADRRLAEGRGGLQKSRAGNTTLRLLLAQFKSPIILILLFAAMLSGYLGDAADAAIILAIVMTSGLLGFWQERGASGAVEKLLALVQSTARVRRNGTEVDAPVEEIVTGDIILLNAGDVIPGDCLLLELKNLFINEAALTGETFPVEKTAGVSLPADTPLARRVNSLFMGTSVSNGTAVALVVATGKDTEFGRVSETLSHRPPETEFERGLRHFGYLLMEVTLLLILCVFAVNVYLHRPVLESFLFALALAVGLTPQLLPAIVSINLARGARRMARARVIVKRLAAIENFGSMDVLCSDKTGTLTEGEVKLHSAVGLDGKPNESLLLHAFLNAHFQSGYTNPIDAAIQAHRSFDVAEYRKLDEQPYDFVRKRLSVLVAHPDNPPILVTKGALNNVLEVCGSAVDESGATAPLAAVREAIERRFNEFSAQGLRTLGVAVREMDAAATGLNRDDERDLKFLGFLLLFDPLRPGIVETIARLRALGVRLKCITGDNALVAASVGRQAGLGDGARVLTGAQLREISNEALPRRADETDLFAEIEPNQKERLILALKKAGHVVGYLGDGINDASALHAADVGISVANAVDVAREAADIVLLEKDLAVLEQGVREGRTTFANTHKYIFMATSANFGTMFSMAGASLLLPFLPLLPKQILLINLLTDLPEMTIAGDRVDAALVEKPRRMDIGFIRRFMIVFGIISSAYDFLTFGALLWLFHANPAQFRTAWFTESVVSAAFIVLVVRTRQPFYRSGPSRGLLWATVAVVLAALILPYAPPLARLFDFTPLPPLYLAVLAGIVCLYVVTAEVAKAAFYRRWP